MGHKQSASLRVLGLGMLRVCEGDRPKHTPAGVTCLGDFEEHSWAPSIGQAFTINAGNIPTCRSSAPTGMTDFDNPAFR